MSPLFSAKCAESVNMFKNIIDKYLVKAGYTYKIREGYTYNSMSRLSISK